MQGTPLSEAFRSFYPQPTPPPAPATSVLNVSANTSMSTPPPTPTPAQHAAWQTYAAMPRTQVLAPAFAPASSPAKPLKRTSKLKKPKPNSKSDSDSDSSDSDSDSSDSDSDDKTSRRKQYKYKRRGRGRGRTPLRVYFRKQPKVDNTFTFQVSKTNVWIAIGVCIIISVVILLVFIGGIQKSVARTEVTHNELLQAVRELTTATATAQSKS